MLSMFMPTLMSSDHTLTLNHMRSGQGKFRYCEYIRCRSKQQILFFSFDMENYGSQVLILKIQLARTAIFLFHIIALK